ncbi:DUF2865 domain-containing protein [Microvirga massiliensis]|uniref:DUF2865 domain-containing protein n=1 Tax=Microvirga massiliensis TaxID=1033741 RepID=UPI0006995AE7|nr:DUF2865 domain-containing protein [Microvirga massiliensis]
MKFRFAPLLVALLAPAGAFAQSPICQQYRAELAALDRGGSRQAAAAAERQRAEIARLSSYYHSIGCERGPLSIFGDPPPAECPSIGRRLRQMEANYAQVARQSESFAGLEARRQQLMAAIQQACSGPQPQQEAAGPRSFLEALFGPPRTQPNADPGLGASQGEAPREQSLGGRRLVCVRTCDGFFFPLANAPGGRESADEMCQALCPGAETQAFSTPGSDDQLYRAVSLNGRPYTSLPNAFRFQKSFDEACSCRKGGQSWTETLRTAESMLEQRKGDIIVTAEKSDELARPKQAAEQKGRQASDRKANEAAEAEAAAEAEVGASAPTAGGESAGIGPKSIESSRVVTRSEGPKLQVSGPDGAKRAVRVVAPNVIPVPEGHQR